MLTQIAACGELFHSATGTAFADLVVDGHRETWPISSKRFRGWLRRRYYEATGGALMGTRSLQRSDLLEARAQFFAKGPGGRLKGPRGAMREAQAVGKLHHDVL